MIIRKILGIVMIILTLFLCGVLGIVEFLEYNFSKKFKIICSVLAVVDIVVIIILVV